MDRVGGGEKLSAEMACRLTGAQAGSNEVRMNRRTVAIARPTGWCMNGSDSIRTDRAPDSCFARFLHVNRYPLRWKTL